MVTIEKIKQYFWFLFGVLGVVLFWAGVWEGLGNIWYLKNPLVSFVMGVFMLTIASVFFKGTNPFWGEKENTASAVLHQIHQHPRKHEFHIKYFDKLKNQEMLIGAGKLKAIEKEFLIILDHGGKELFIPIHRVTEVLHKGKTHWKA